MLMPRSSADSVTVAVAQLLRKRCSCGIRVISLWAFQQLSSHTVCCLMICLDMEIELIYAILFAILWRRVCARDCRQGASRVFFASYCMHACRVQHLTCPISICLQHRCNIAEDCSSHYIHQLQDLPPKIRSQAHIQRPCRLIIREWP